VRARSFQCSVTVLPLGLLPLILSLLFSSFYSSKSLWQQWWWTFLLPYLQNSPGFYDTNLAIEWWWTFCYTTILSRILDCSNTITSELRYIFFAPRISLLFFLVFCAPCSTQHNKGVFVGCIFMLCECICCRTKSK